MGDKSLIKEPDLLLKLDWPTMPKFTMLILQSRDCLLLDSRRMDWQSAYEPTFRS